MPRARGCSLLLGLMALACREGPDVESPRVAFSAPIPKSALVVPSPSVKVADVTAPVVTATPLPELPAMAEQRLLLAAGGDVNFGRECGQAILQDLGYAPFAGLSAAWSSADLRFVNLESQLSDQNGVTQSPRNRLIFSGPPGGADVLAAAGISLVSTANNHAWDYGRSALLETIANLERARVPFAGTGVDVEAAYRPVVARMKGLSVALFAVTHIWNQGHFDGHEGQKHVAWADIDMLRAGIQRARKEHDFVIVSYHGGEEYISAPVDKTRRFVKAVMALGVDAFIGHHPHVPQGVGWVQGRPVLYSLGNLVFAGHDDRPWTKQSFFARLELEKGKPPKLAACPYALDGHRPRSLLSSESHALARFRRHLIDISTSTGGSTVAEPDEFGCLPVTPLVKK
jgi:poly-gamma-glutamate capsule biosynthesis protein CapA/YwtB (metallophosphatase superfamily)